GGDVAIDRQVRQELLNLRRAHRIWMFDAVIADVALRPMDITSLRPDRKMFEPRRLTNLIEQFHGESPCRQFSMTSAKTPPRRHCSCNACVVGIIDICTYVQ